MKSQIKEELASIIATDNRLDATSDKKLKFFSAKPTFMAVTMTVFACFLAFTQYNRMSPISATQASVIRAMARDIAQSKGLNVTTIYKDIARLSRKPEIRDIEKAQYNEVVAFLSIQVSEKSSKENSK